MPAHCNASCRFIPVHRFTFISFSCLLPLPLLWAHRTSGFCAYGHSTPPNGDEEEQSRRERERERYRGGGRCRQRHLALLITAYYKFSHAFCICVCNQKFNRLVAVRRCSSLVTSNAIGDLHSLSTHTIYHSLSVCVCASACAWPISGPCHAAVCFVLLKIEFNFFFVSLSPSLSLIQPVVVCVLFLLFCCCRCCRIVNCLLLWHASMWCDVSTFPHTPKNEKNYMCSLYFGSRRWFEVRDDVRHTLHAAMYGVRQRGTGDCNHRIAFEMNSDSSSVGLADICS